MCRWLAYSGSPVRIEDLIYKPEHSLIDQSLHSKLGAETTNGDGFGIGWYGVGETPGVFHSVEPAWNDWNLRELAGHIESPVVFAHIRASSGTPVQQTNCHPFRRGRWLWMHNGLIGDFHRVKRDLVLRVDPELYPELQGSSDSEVLLLPRADVRARGRPAGCGRAGGRAHRGDWSRARSRASDPDDRRDDRRPKRLGIPLFERGKSRSLFYSHGREHAAPHRTRRLPALAELSDESRLIVSEPLRDLAGVWNEVPESSYGVIQEGQDEMRPFTPRPPAQS